MIWYQRKRGERNRGDILSSFTEAVLRLIFFLSLVVLLAYVSLRYGLGRLQKNTWNSQLQIVDRLFLGSKSGLFVIKVAEQYFLLAVTEQHIEILKELPEYPMINTPFSELEVGNTVSQFREAIKTGFGKRGSKS